MKKLLSTVLYKTKRFTNGLGSQKKCYVCGRTFTRFTKFKGGTKNQSSYRALLKNIGSDTDNYSCMYCGCNDRERHLFMYFDKLKLWERMKKMKILHFAPERYVQVRIKEQEPPEYIKADLFPAHADMEKIDATDIQYDDGVFDCLISNHILEHIPDYQKALSEFYRVLKPGGIAILQTPYSTLLIKNFEDDAINTEELRLFFHGQEDHVRTFGEQQFLSSIEEAGFKLNIQKHKELFNADEAELYGVNGEEDLILVEK